MNFERKLIVKIKAHPILYDSKVKKDPVTEEKAWQQLAQECHMKNSTTTKQIWQQLLTNYVHYLRKGGDFPHARQMVFMQEQLFANEDTSWDVQLNKVELQQLLNSPTSICEESTRKDKSDNIIKPDIFAAMNRNEAVMWGATINDDDDDQTKSLTFSPILHSETESRVLNFTSLELIFLGYAKELQKMPLHIQIQTKRKIANIMEEVETLMLNQQTLGQKNG